MTFTHYPDGTAQQKIGCKGMILCMSVMYRRGVTCFSCMMCMERNTTRHCGNLRNQLCLDCHGPLSNEWPTHGNSLRASHHKKKVPQEAAASPATCENRYDDKLT